MEKVFKDELMDLLRQKNLRKLKDELITFNEADIALFIEDLTDLEAVAVFRILPKNIAAETFAYFSREVQNNIIGSMTNTEITEIVDDLYIDDVVDMLEELPANVVKKIMKNVPTERRGIINQYLQYPDDSAGSIMTAEFIDIKMKNTVGSAIKIIRQRALDTESVYTVYITDTWRRLVGFVSVRTLLVNKNDTKLEDLIEEDVIYVTTTDDQEYVARQFAKYGFLSLPVVDREKRLVGMVTIDDAVDVLDEEATEDFEKMAAMTPSEKPYIKSSIWELSKNRLTWLVFLMLSGTISGMIMLKFEDALGSLMGVAAFIPMLMGAGGNAGSQASTMIIRGLSIGEIESKDYLKVFLKEFGVSFLVGIALAIVNFIRIILLKPGQTMLALTVSLSLVITIMIAKSVGGLLPLLAKKLSLDPALMAAPLITTIVDALSLIVYFFFVQTILL
ncbi:MAG: magnesium transporter [Tissierellia bacterium]|nr:magnesium transporter [Tissierellia bacterium]